MTAMRALAAAAVAVSIGLAGPALAKTVSITQQSPGSGLNPFGSGLAGSERFYQEQTIRFTENGTTQTRNNVPSGMFRLQIDGVNFNAFCVEILTNLNLPKNYTLQNFAYGANTYGAMAMARLDALITNVFDEDLVNSPETGNAFQLAVWEITKEGVTT